MAGYHGEGEARGTPPHVGWLVKALQRHTIRIHYFSADSHLTPLKQKEAKLQRHRFSSWGSYGEGKGPDFTQ